MKKQWIQIHPKDAVAVALEPLGKGQTIVGENFEVTLKEDIPQGHKFTLHPIKKGEALLKYGHPIGEATQDIDSGSWVHTHNMKTRLNDELTYEYHPDFKPLEKKDPRTFMGYKRENGKAGVKNEIWIIPTVGCVNNTAAAIEKVCQDLVGENVEAVCAFGHPYGCSQMGDDQENTRKILSDLIVHPNAGGVLVLGLGCENSNISELKKLLGDEDLSRVEFVNSQDYEDEIEEGINRVRKLAEKMKDDKRVPISVDELIIGLKCGGSDGLSGITANPTVGAFSDLLVAQGGTTILTEVPEMFGAETLLMNRAANEEIFDQTVELINGFKQYFKANHQVVYENPSPGNKKGGISTLEDKSLGCTQKSGSAPVEGVLSYGERVKSKGLNLLQAPGNDLVAATALAASGAQIVLFTTGRGTPFASPVPTIKISSNSDLVRRKPKWIDFNCGVLVEDTTLPELANQFFDFVIDTASGRKTTSEEAGFHDMAIFKQGVTL